MKPWRHPYIRAGGVIVTLLVLAALLAPWISPFAPDAIRLEERYQPPSWNHWFGTDEMGRDVFSRVVHGTRISLGIGVSARTLGLLI
ncbi:MAG TPA: peptide ABC transporter permease, partial [bacterium]|nr:peptide ABC transporter permease [bacterium]